VRGVNAGLGKWKMGIEIKIDGVVRRRKMAREGK
jgi:hypothetical protein